MSRMLQNVLRWQQPSRFQRSPNRWLLWVQGLNQGRDRLPQRHPLTLTLHQQLPFPLNSSVHSYWQTNTWQFFPQIHLSITPLLRELSHQSQTSWVFQSYSREQTNPVAIASPKVIQRETFPWRSNQTLVPAIHREFLIPQLSREQTNSFHETSSPPGSGERTVFRITPVPIQFSPLQQVFQRVQQPVTHFHSNLLTQENPQLVQRITRDRQRVEESRSQAAVVHHGIKPPSEQSGAIAPPSSMPSVLSANSLMSDRPPGFPTPFPPAINLEQLTDQVMRQLDSRIVAQRERMGRTF